MQLKNCQPETWDSHSFSQDLGFIAHHTFDFGPLKKLVKIYRPLSISPKNSLRVWRGDPAIFGEKIKVNNTFQIRSDLTCSRHCSRSNIFCVRADCSSVVSHECAVPYSRVSFRINNFGISATPQLLCRSDCPLDNWFLATVLDKMKVPSFTDDYRRTRGNNFSACSTGICRLGPNPCSSHNMWIWPKVLLAERSSATFPRHQTIPVK